MTCKSASMAAGDACAAADAGYAFDAGDASELVMPKSIRPEPRLTNQHASP